MEVQFKMSQRRRNGDTIIGKVQAAEQEKVATARQQHGKHATIRDVVFSMWSLSQQ
jgi:hypothetical protein